MKTAWIRFSFFSLALHLVIFWMLWHGAPVERGTTRITNSLNTAHPVLRAEIVVDKRLQQQAFSSAEHSDAAPVPDRNIPIGKLPVEATSQEFGPAAYSAVSEQTITSYHFQAGSLTRLPVPITDIDLDVPDIHDLAFPGTTELTILIDERGTVVEVLTSKEHESMHMFVDLVIARFKNTRFTPGEINGKAVKSQLQIIVVSETTSASKI